MLGSWGKGCQLRTMNICVELLKKRVEVDKKWEFMLFMLLKKSISVGNSWWIIKKIVSVENNGNLCWVLEETCVSLSREFMLTQSSLFNEKWLPENLDLRPGLLSEKYHS